MSSDWEDPAAGFDGWTVLGDGSPLTRVPSGGNPGAFLRVADLGQGSFMYWNAPAKFLGDLSAAHGGTLSFDLQQSQNTNPVDNTDVFLIGATITLAFNTANDPAVTPAWSRYTIPLLASAGWRVGNNQGIAATEAQMQAVLSTLTGLRIRAEYQTGPVDTDGIDNVVLASSDVPEPGTALCALLGLATIWRRIPGARQ